MIKCPCGDGEIFGYGAIIEKSRLEVSTCGKWVEPTETIDSWGTNYEGDQYECDKCARSFTAAELLALDPDGTRKT